MFSVSIRTQLLNTGALFGSGSTSGSSCSCLTGHFSPCDTGVLWPERVDPGRLGKGVIVTVGSTAATQGNSSPEVADRRG